MITLQKLDIYEKYRGDIDGFARGGKTEHDLITNDEWKVIQDLLQNILILESGNASGSFEASTKKLLDESCDNELTKAKLKELSKRI